MALETYRRKRDFAATPEPPGTRAAAAGRRFVVQKHAARRLHYDLRLELDGVLKSWAVTRGPSLVPSERRLAVQVEDHPLDYADFEGTIPKGEYGGGEVIVWDRGRWKPKGDPEAGLRKGHLEFDLHGRKLKGRWHLVRMAARRGEKGDNWLLIKGADAYARSEDDPDILTEAPDSVKSGRAVEEPADPPAPRRTRAKPAGDFPDFVPPELATLKPAPPRGPRWVHEIKFDGYRLQARIHDGEVTLLTRSGQDWTGRFGPTLPRALAALPARDAIVDGELVVEDTGGASDFAALQADLAAGRTDRFVFYAFDLLWRDGADLRGRPLIERKAALAELLAGAGPPIRMSEHVDVEGELVLRNACRLSLEGVVSKLRDARYRSGRTGDWIKSKCSDHQEFVVAGYVPSAAERDAIGSLVLGYWRDAVLVHAGRVGTGFSRTLARDLFRRLQPLRRDRAPFAEPLSAEARRGAVFVAPELVAEVEFRSWTADGLVRHASFRGLRDDKPASEVTGETNRPAERPAPALRLTNPDRVYWEDAGITKQGLAEYYSEVWPRMAPYLVRRPLALLRCPGGTAAKCFFQKHAWKGLSRDILTFDDPNDTSDEPILAVDSLAGLVGLVQGGALELHGWQATLDALETPDQIVMDLDPGEGVGWGPIVAAAREVRARLEGAGLAAFVKTTGGKGLHVVAPLEPAAGWTAVSGFARDLAREMAADAPDRFVATVAKARRRGRILVDYLRNGRGATAVAPYSSRARAGAPVAMPLAWEELRPDTSGPRFTVGNTPARMADLAADPWADFRAAAVPLPGGGRRGTA